MDETREPTQDLDCPQCGCGVPALAWHEPDEEWPDGEYLAWDGDEHVCPECGWYLQVHTDGEEPAFLVGVHCPHGCAEDETCWRCGLVEWLDWQWRQVRRVCRESWCWLLRRHQWRQVAGTASRSCSKCGRFVFVYEPGFKP